jgi:bifunctional ADP-heptose synthase (sugar kinase/adenylyltransferase)
VGDLARRDGVTVIDLGRQGTTAERRRVFDGARLILRVDDGLPGIVGAITSRARAALQTADAVLVADYGQGVAAEPSVREALMSCVAPLVWDPHPLGAAVLAGATVVTPNEREAALPGSATTEAALTIGAALARRYGALSACITRGARGAVLAFAEGGGVELPAKSIHDGDDCGAGDRLAVAIAGALARGASVEKAARHAIAPAGRFGATGAC